MLRSACDVPGVEAALSDELAVNVLVGIARAEGDVSALNPHEMAVYHGVSGPRRHSWLNGRLALKRLLQRMDQDPDTEHVTFPHAQISLTHSRYLAVALGTRDKDGLGVGVDLEFPRPVKPQAARFFLRQGERQWLERFDQETKSREMLRLWTVKEAVFKSDLANKDRLLSDYEVRDPGAETGSARAADRSGTIVYTTLVFEGALLSAAIMQGVLLRAR